LHAIFLREGVVTTAAENVARLKQAYGQWVAVEGKDFQCWMDVLADDAKLCSIAEGAPEAPFTARRTTKSEIRTYLEELTRDWEMISHDMNEFIAQDDRVVVIGDVEWRNKATGKSAKTRKVDVWRFRDGTAVDFEELYDTAGMFAAARPD
jgi:uncharacterized protein